MNFILWTRQLSNGRIKMRKCCTAGLLIVLAMSLGGNVYLLNRLGQLRHRLDDRSELLECETGELKQRRTVMAIDSLLLQIDLYMTLTGQPPSVIDVLRAPLDADGPNWPLDCYGKKLEYNVSTNEAMLVSAGSDGVFGTDDDIVGRLSLKHALREIESPVGNWFSAATDCSSGSIKGGHANE